MRDFSEYNKTFSYLENIVDYITRDHVMVRPLPICLEHAKRFVESLCQRDDCWYPSTDVWEDIVSTPWRTITVDIEVGDKGSVSIEFGENEYCYFCEFDDSDESFSSGTKYDDNFPETLYNLIKKE